MTEAQSNPPRTPEKQTAPISDAELKEAARNARTELEDEETSALVARLEADADRDIAARTITLRWGADQVDVVKHAARLLGVPYQTYLKQAVIRQALADIEQAERVGRSRR
jgi:predicted DNA binding CopG/RHH family protein